MTRAPLSLRVAHGHERHPDLAEGLGVDDGRAAVVRAFLEGVQVGRLVEELLAVAVGGALGPGAVDVADQHLVVVGDVACQEHLEHPLDVVERATVLGSRRSLRNSAISWLIWLVTERSIRDDSRA